MYKLKTTVNSDPKACFDDIYIQDDPRQYFSKLGALDYAIPDLAHPVLGQVADAWRRQSGAPATILDLGSSYGINAALHRFPITFAMLRERYSRREILELSTEQLLPLDRRYFQSWPQAREDRLICLDASRQAIDYVQSVGIAHDALAADFESNRPDREAAAKLADVDIVFSTGCVGYVGVKTFDAILSSAKRTPWVVSFVLRMYGYEEIIARLEDAGLVTEKLASAAFMQRRFRDPDEARSVIDLLHARGVDPTDLEAEGMLFAELFVSRPPEAVKAEPLADLVTLANGRDLNLGPRLLHLERRGHAEIIAAR